MVKKEELIELISEVLGTSVNEDSNSENCEKWDSMAALRIAIAIEDKFGIEIEPEKIVKLISFEKIYKLLSGTK